MTPSEGGRSTPLFSFLLLLLLSWAWWGCGEGSPRPEPTSSAEAETPFSEVAAAAGLDFVHFNGRSGRLYFPEMMGAGAGLLDADNDGDLDVYLVQGRMLPADLPVSEAIDPPHARPYTDRLYRNDLPAAAEGTGLRFVDVTAESGLPSGDYGMGVAAGDYDNDGRVDLYVANFGGNRLLRNATDEEGIIRFEDRTAEAGVDDRRWSVAALFFDYDRDGWLDLFVGNYLDYTLGTDRPCYDLAGARDYCGPQAYRGEPNRLFRNRGPDDRGRVTFEDVTLRAGLGSHRSRTLGAGTGDFDGDGLLELYVANDGEPNQLWRQSGDGSFEDVALFAGCALNGDGRPEASMGVAVGDVDGDGDEDLFVTHLTEETNTLYLNRSAAGGLSFSDETRRSGLGAPSLPLTGFGTALFDYDNDSALDLLTVNGAVRHLAELVEAGDPYPLHQQRQLFRNEGDGRFDRVAAGAAFAPSEVGRGAAFGDLDNDGDTDVLVNNNGGPARLLRNDVGSANAWIGLRLIDGGDGAVAGRVRDMLGARVTLLLPSGARLVRRVRTDGSYASAHDPRLLFGLDAGTESGRVSARVRWPDGRMETWTDLVPGRYSTLRQGEGSATADP